MKTITNLFFGRKPEARELSMRRRIDLGPLHLSHAIYAIGDVHGCLAELLKAEQRILDDIAARGERGIVVLLGDYVDRGPDSAGVLDHLVRSETAGFRRLPLCGNHDDAFLQFLDTPSTSSGWLDFGGRDTLRSYGIDTYQVLRQGGSKSALHEVAIRSVPEEHIAFLRDLPVALKIGPCLFVHAGIRPGIALEEQTDEDLMWIREPFLTDGPGLPINVIHGHTVCKTPVFANRRISIDTGAFATGRLTVLRISRGMATIL